MKTLDKIILTIIFFIFIFVLASFIHETTHIIFSKTNPQENVKQVCFLGVDKLDVGILNSFGGWVYIETNNIKNRASEEIFCYAISCLISGALFVFLFVRYVLEEKKNEIT